MKRSPVTVGLLILALAVGATATSVWKQNSLRASLGGASGSASSGAACSAVCGDGIAMAPEQCDDGNRIDVDICDNNCRINCSSDEDCPIGQWCVNHKCTPVSSSAASQGNVSSGGACGNGLIQPGEECDDGNNRNGDCCSSTCRIEPGCQCFVGPAGGGAASSVPPASSVASIPSSSVAAISSSIGVNSSAAVVQPSSQPIASSAVAVPSSVPAVTSSAHGAAGSSAAGTPTFVACPPGQACSISQPDSNGQCFFSMDLCPNGDLPTDVTSNTCGVPNNQDCSGICVVCP